MQHSPRPRSSSDLLPERFLFVLAGFADLFTRPTWPNVLLLLAGVILTPGRRTIAAALRILGLERDPKFCTFHRILNRAAWSSRAAASRLLLLLIASFLPATAPVVIGFDDTIERRWGPKISARGIYRDPVRSSKGHFVKASGLRWLSAMLLVHVPWADRIMALPFLTLLAPSKRFYAGKLRAPKTLVDWARQAALQIRRWLPDRYIVLVADSAFAAIEFLAAVRGHVCVVTRLRLDANLFAFPPAKRKGRGRPAIKGKRLRKLSAVLKDPKISWQRCRISLWYGRTNRLVEITSGTALWYRAGVPPVPIRWLLVRDPKGELDPQAFLATELDARPQDILAWFVRRWQVGSRAIGSRDPAPVVRHGDTAHHARPPGSVLHHHVIRARSRQVPETQDQNRRMVSKGPADLQRRHRGGAPGNMGASDFFHVAAEPRPCRNSEAYLASHAKRARVRRLDRPKSS